nr:hypothetical protein GCM10020092_067500 [Actinoplanes digitatis]
MVGSGEGRGWFEPSPRADGDEATQVHPVVPARPPTVAARAVIVYEERPRRPWRLWVFTVALVALTVGVVLGQTVAFEPVYRQAAGAGTVPDGSASPAPPAQPFPDAAHRVTAPLGSVRTRLLEVAGASAVVRVRSEDLGATLFDIATTDRGAVPVLTESARGHRLELLRTGEAGDGGRRDPAQREGGLDPAVHRRRYGAEHRHAGWRPARRRGRRRHHTPRAATG